MPISGEKLMKKPGPHPGHEHHLCSMIEKSGVTPEIKALIKNPKYNCSCCGRAAAKKENLCLPEPL
jgi:hypothetical protein